MKRTLHLESLSNGLGCQSMLLFLMACRREIPATVSITADTGWESDRVWSDGTRASSKEYFNRIVFPLAKKYGFDARFVRSEDKEKVALPDLGAYIKQVAESGNFKGVNIPMFGSRKGRLVQRCTDKMKIRACRQEARRMGAKTNCNAQGIHIGESIRRASGEYLRMNGKWSIYQTQIKKKVNGIVEWVDIKWQTHYYPLVDLKLNRNDCQRLMVKEGIPYIISTECDGCPHKDLARWERTDAVVLADLCATEKLFNGEFFFTDKRIPLMDSITKMQSERAADPERYKVEADFGCSNAVCGI